VLELMIIVRITMVW